MDPRGLTLSLGVPPEFSAFPRKCKEISKVEYEGARNSPEADTAQGLKDIEKVTLAKGSIGPLLRRTAAIPPPGPGAA